MTQREIERRGSSAEPASVEGEAGVVSSSCRSAFASIARVLAVLLALCPTPLPAQSPPELYERGLEAMRERQFAQAVRDFQQAIALDPGLAKAHGALGTLYFQLGRLDEAERLVEQTLEIRRRVLGEDAPQTLASVVRLGSIAALRGDRAKALGLLREAIEHGYKDTKRLVRDPDLGSLQGDPDFAALLDLAKSKATTSP